MLADRIGNQPPGSGFLHDPDPLLRGNQARKDRGILLPAGVLAQLDLKIGDEVKLGGSTLVAHLTAGHTRGCTTWTMRVQDAGKSVDVVFACSYRAPGNVTPEIETEFNRTFPLLRTLPCDVPLGDHPAQYNMMDKYARLQTGAPNPFVDPSGCWLEA